MHLHMADHSILTDSTTWMEYLLSKTSYEKFSKQECDVD